MVIETNRISQSFGFVLLPNFALMSYASATEPLRAANLLAGRSLYVVRSLSLGGQPVRSSGGVEIACDDIGEVGPDLHAVLVCAGGGPQDWVGGDKLFSALRRLSRLGVRIGAISSGSYLLAAAGLLDGRDFTIHWEHAPVLREAFPNLTPRQARYVIDGDRITCGGGVAPLDMMHALIAERMGAHFAGRVSDWYLHTAVAESTDPQRGSDAERYGTNNPILLSAIHKMQATIENPIDRTAMARFLGTSPRHLNRLFHQHLDTGFLQFYRAIRLQHARQLLEQGPLSLLEIAVATGFSSTTHFSTAFRKHFGMPPGRKRDVSARERRQASS